MMVRNDSLTDEEWWNVPEVVRRVISGLSGEVSNQKNVIDRLRQDQEDTSVLLKRVIHKQTDIEIDVTKSLLSVQTALPAHNATDDKFSTLQREVEKVGKKIKRQDVQLKSSLAEESTAILTSCEELVKKENAKLLEKIEAQDRQISKLVKNLKTCEASLAEAHSKIEQHQRENKLSEEKADASFTSLTKNLKEVEEGLSTQKSNLAKMEDKQQSSSNAVHLIGTSLEERINTLTDAVARVKDSFQERHRALQSELRELKDNYTEAIRKLNAEAAQNHTELRKCVSSLDTSITDVEKKLESEIKTVESDLLETFRKSLEEMFLITTQKLSVFGDTHSSTLKDFEDQVDKLRVVVEAKVVNDENALVEAREEYDSARSSIIPLENRLTSLENQIPHLLRAVTNLQDSSDRDKAFYANEIQTLRITEREEENKKSLLNVSGTVAFNEIREDFAHLQEEFKSLKSKTKNMWSKLEENEQNYVVSNNLREILKQYATTGKMAELEEAVCESQKVQEDLTKKSKALEKSFNEYREECEHSRLQAANSTRDHNEPHTPPVVVEKVAENLGSEKLTHLAIEVEGIKRRLATMDVDRVNSVHDRESLEQAVYRQINSRNNPQLDAIQQDVKRQQLDSSKWLLRLEERLAAFCENLSGVESRVAGNEDMVSKLSKDMTQLLENVLKLSESNSSFRKQTESKLTEIGNAMEDASAGKEDAISIVLAQMDDFKKDFDGELVRLDGQVKEAQSNQEDVTDAVLQLSNRVLNLDATLESVSGKQSEMNNLIAALPRGSVPIKEYNQWKNSVDYSLGSLQASIDEMRDNGRTDTDVSSAGFLEIKLDKLVDQVELIQRQLQKVEATTRVKPAENETDLRRQFVSINETLTKRLEGVEEKIASLNGIYVTEQGFKSFVENEFNTFCEHCTNEVNQVRSSLSERCDEIKELQDSAVKKDDLQISQAPKEESEKSVSDNDVGNDLILFQDELENRMLKSEEVIESLLNVHQKLNEAVQGNYYTKQVLEERFENLWNSIISLVARKDDSEAVNKKLSGLQKLLSEEIDIQLKGLSSELNNTIAAKVSFAELQEILSRQLDDV